jgi:hypothetical protein
VSGLVNRQGQPLAPAGNVSLLRVKGVWVVECRDRHGNLKWRDESENLVVNVGLTYLIGVALLTTTQIALTSWFVGITATAPTVAAADTMASHGGWTENQTYSQATRPAWSGVAGAAGAASNTASPAAFSANGSSTAGGCFLASNSTKGGTTGTLFSAVAFTGGDRALVNGDTLNVTYNLSVVDDAV